MTLSNITTVLIVDRSHDWAPALRQRLVSAGIRVHVVDTHDMAVRFAGVKKIDVAVVEYAMDGWTDELCAALRRHGVPYVFTAENEQIGHVKHPRGSIPAGAAFDVAMYAN